MKLSSLIEQHGNGPITLGDKFIYNIWDIFQKNKFIQRKPNKPPRTKNNWGGTLDFSFRRDRPAIVNSAGIYAWSHPDFGYFYIGISARKSHNRWKTHVAKLIDHCNANGPGSNPFPVKWQQFVQRFVDLGYRIEDLDKVQIRFYPIPVPTDTADFKKYLEAIEHRIVLKLNPACNKEYDPTKPSTTRFPEPKS